MEEASALIDAVRYNRENNLDFPCKEDMEMMRRAKWLIAEVLSITNNVISSPECHCATALAQSRCKHYRAYECCKQEDLLTGM